jgi:hypothetical protein
VTLDEVPVSVPPLAQIADPVGPDRVAIDKAVPDLALKVQRTCRPLRTMAVTAILAEDGTVIDATSDEGGARFARCVAETLGGATVPREGSGVVKIRLRVSPNR